ncbi:uncharacterized protein LOC132644010 [Lycium barbarum]|uniref:uncharacterized protein LOC132644010 n=1 Tax=Lycium barbarum TaxID=112863 RepID=UPI00293E36FF|nr:uncharacterized protein LOC132644010 [Lycium barbarum]
MTRKTKATAARKGKSVVDEAVSQAPRSTRAQTYVGVHIQSQSSPTPPSSEELRGAPDPAPAPAPAPGTDPNADPQEFIDGMQRTLIVMKASTTESVELAAYRLQGITINWFQSWRLSRGRDALPPTWQEFSDAFLRHYMPPELRRARVDSILNLRQGNMSVREYSVEFDSLARYAPSIV